MTPRHRPGLVRRFLGGLRRALTENLGLKFICLVCATLLVAYQRSQTDEKARTIAFTLDTQLPPQQARRQLTTPLPPHVNVTVQGSSNALDDLAASLPSIDLDLRKGERARIDFTADLFDLPPGLSVRGIDPPTLKLSWEDVVTRQLRVQASVTGSVAQGYEVASMVVEPEFVGIQGPASAVRIVQLARVAPFDISGLSTGTYRRQLALDPAPSGTTYLDAADVVTVTVQIQERQLSVNFPGLPVDVVGIPGARVVPDEVDVTVRGAPEVVRALQPEMVAPRVDATQVNTESHGSAIMKVQVDLSRATTEIQPPSVKVSW
jgi:YbbR domain-containing protein